MTRPDFRRTRHVVGGVAERAQLEGLTQALLQAETLDAPAAYAAAGVETRTVPAERRLAAA
jgi:hypothetical protein